MERGFICRLTTEQVTTRLLLTRNDFFAKRMVPFHSKRETDMENKGKEESCRFEETYDKEKFELDEARLSALLRIMLGFEFS